jgi:DNA-binding NtrC family response regulator
MNKTVLVIDDEQDLRELLCLTLSRMDITAYCRGDHRRSKAPAR